MTCCGLKAKENENMKKLSLLLAGAVLMTGLSTGAHALTLTLSDGVNSVNVTDGGIGDSNSAIGAITYIGSLGNFTLNVSTGLSTPVLAMGSMDINSVNVSSSGGGTLTITLTDTGLILPTVATVPNTLVSQYIGGTTSGGSTVTFSTSFDGGTIGTIGPLAGPSFSGDLVNTITTTNPFSLTEIVTVSQAVAGITSFDAGVTTAPVPEPGTMVLLGVGLLGIAIYGKRRMNKDA